MRESEYSPIRFESDYSTHQYQCLSLHLIFLLPVILIHKVLKDITAKIDYCINFLRFFVIVRCMIVI